MQLLTFWQCAVEQAGDVETALVRLRTARDPFDAVVADLEMPEGGAERLAARMREDAGLACVPLVSLVPLTHIEHNPVGISPRFAGTVTKPVKHGELAACLGSVFGDGSKFTHAAPRVAEDWRGDLASRAKVRILLVEDNPTNQEVALGMLDNLGYGADLAGDGRSALRTFMQKEYDLVLMDCQLPDLDGYEATRLIRWPGTQVRNHEIPIIAMTANAMTGDREQCLAAGMNDYLSKPIDRTALEQAVARWTAGNERAGAPPAEAPAPRGAAEFEQEDLLERLSGNEDLAQRVVNRFLNDMPQQLGALSQAINDGTPKARAKPRTRSKGPPQMSGDSRCASWR